MRRASASVCMLLLACGRVAPGAHDGATSTESESGLSELEESEESGQPDPDLPAEPECPAGLGDVVTCECAVIDECSVMDAADAGCAFACDVPSPCPAVTCTFDISTQLPGCDTVDVAALECVFDALAEGQPIRWATTLTDTGFYNEHHDSSHDYLRVDATTYAWSSEFHAGFHGQDESSHYGFGAFELPEAAWMECEALAVDTERFECLHALRGEPCPDASLLICP